MAPTHELVIVANRLPVDRKVDEQGEVTWQTSPGGLVTALEPVLRRRGGIWVGWTGAVGETSERIDADGLDLAAVPLSAGEVADYYEGMSNATLWPLYHDVISPPIFHRHWWESYCAVNRRFATVAAEHAREGATVWVQDYQLQLVPRMLREARPDVRIGFFNHIPFPPYEIFAQLPWRRQVLLGLLGADLLGFQRPADANNVLRACRRLGIATRRGHALVAAPSGVREVRCAAFPISVDTDQLDRIARREDVIARSWQIRNELGDPETLMLGVDRLDYTKGIRHRIKAVGELFDEGRLHTPAVSFVQVATPSRERVGSYQALRDEVEVEVGRINGKHGRLGHPAIHYLHQSFPREELSALYQAADVMLVTALRDGMNLVAKEYVASRHDERGSLVLSEFTGAANELTSAHLINPHDIDGLKETIIRAMHTSGREQARRMRAMRRHVGRRTVSRWARDFLTALGEPDDVIEAATPGPDPLHAALVDFSAGQEILVASDFDGVIAPIVERPDQARPLSTAMLALEELAALPGTHVALVSGRSLDSLRRQANPPDGIALIGGHGAEAEGDETLMAAVRLHELGLDDDRRHLLETVSGELQEIAADHRGATIERKATSTTLHTRGVDREAVQAVEQAVLSGPAMREGIHLIRGKEVLELSVSRATKGTALAAVREHLRLAPGTLLYLGDDVTDEQAFEVLDPVAGDVSIKVGEGPTAAAYRVWGPEAVADLLQWLAGLRSQATSPGG